MYEGVKDLFLRGENEQDFVKRTWLYTDLSVWVHHLKSANENCPTNAGVFRRLMSSHDVGGQRNIAGFAVQAAGNNNANDHRFRRTGWFTDTICCINPRFVPRSCKSFVLVAWVINEQDSRHKRGIEEN